MMGSIVWNIISFLIWPIVIIALIVFFAVRLRKRAHLGIEKEWYLRLTLFKGDGVSQMLVLLSIFFFGTAILAFSRDFGGQLSWQTVLLISSAVGLVVAYVLRMFYPLTFSLLGIFFWWGSQTSEWLSGKNVNQSAIFVGLVFLSLLFYSLGRWHERNAKWRRFAMVYCVLGILTTTGFLFAFSSNWGVYSLGEMTKGSFFSCSWQVILLFLALFIFLAGMLFFNVWKKIMSLAETLAAAFLMVFFGIIIFLPEQIVSTYQNGLFYASRVSISGMTEVGFIWAVIFNLVLFFELLGLILLGYQRREIWLINLGAFFLFILVIVKYFDWFFTFMDKSLFFIGAGILLFVVGWFMEKGRRRMISSLKAKS